MSNGLHRRSIRSAKSIAKAGLADHAEWIADTALFVRSALSERTAQSQVSVVPQMIYNEAITAAMLAQMQDAQPDRIILTGD